MKCKESISNLSYFRRPILWLALSFIGCSSTKVQDDSLASKPGQVDGVYRIQEDRTRFEQLRQEIPPDVRMENDELAFDFELFANEKKSPSEIRSKFDRTLRSKRDKVNKDLASEREIFTKSERKNREAFLKDLQKKRSDFQSIKRSREERADFFREQDEQRRSFFADERDKRAEYEARLREKRKDFDDYARQKQNSFYQDWRAYSKKYDHEKKNKDTPQADLQQIEQVLESSRDLPSQKLRHER